MNLSLIYQGYLQFHLSSLKIRTIFEIKPQNAHGDLGLHPPKPSKHTKTAFRYSAMLIQQSLLTSGQNFFRLERLLSKNFAVVILQFGWLLATLPLFHVDDVKGEEGECQENSHEWGDREGDEWGQRYSYYYLIHFLRNGGIYRTSALVVWGNKHHYENPVFTFRLEDGWLIWAAVDLLFTRCPHICPCI